MNIDAKIAYSFDQALTDSSLASSAQWAHGILTMRAHDKLFVSGHCESPSPFGLRFEKIPPQWIFEMDRQCKNGVAICL